MRQYAPEPRIYELMTILSPEVPDDDIQGQLDTVAGYVTGAGGEVVDVIRDSPWGRRRLAYAIRHNGRDVRDGYYTVFHLKLVPTRVVEVEREIKLNGQIIRHLITQYEPQAVTATVAPTEAAATTAGEADELAGSEAGERPAAQAVESEAAAPASPRRRSSRSAQAAAEPTAPATVEAAQPEPATAPEPEVAQAAPEPPEASVPDTSEASAPDTSAAADSQPQVETAAGTEDQVAQADTTTPGDEPENLPAQPDATPEEE